MITLDALAARVSAVSIVSDDATWTYQDLATRAHDLVKRLTNAGVLRGDVVALDVDRSPEHVVGMLAAWHLGAAFFPVDPRSPRDRVSSCLMETRARALVTVDAISTLDRDVPLGTQDDALAYVIYTSGSTGRPKGVRLSHHGLWPMLAAQVSAFHLGPGKRSLFSLSTAFDASISDIGTALISGATLVIPRTLPSVRELSALLGVLAITHADLPPSILPLVDPASLPASFETVIVGGEPCAPAAVRAWSARARVVNVYGPTEATICTHLCECDATWDRPRLGHPLAHVRTRVENDELMLGGPALALGYIDRPELEANKFVMRDGERWYKTGDRVREHADGSPEFMGRIDRQLKVRGQLVSPEEVEARLLELAGVAAAVVSVDGDSLVASVVPSAVLDVSRMREELARSLPQWMLPRIDIATDLPRGSTGKIDYRAASHSPAAVIARAFRDVLAVAADEQSDFLSLGGHSLSALEVAARAALDGVHVDASTILVARTPSAIASFEPTLPTAGELDGRAARLCDELESDDAQGEVGEVGEWLITGSTGFLGSRVIDALFERTNERVHVVVRASSDAQAAARSHPRVVAHAGDVSLPRLGLTRATWDELAASVGHVLHAAAAVNMALSYESLASVNVRGALEVARFARTGRRKRVTHVSSLAVLVQTDDATRVIDEHTTLPSDAHVFGGYAQTKHVAESILARVDALIVRPGLLTGDSRTGLAAKTCQLAWLIQNLSRLGCVPEGDHERLRVDVTPIDYASNVITDLVIMPKTEPIVHVASSDGASLLDVLSALRRRVAVQTVTSEEWRARAAEVLPRDVAMALLSTSHRLHGVTAHREADLFLLTGRHFDVRRAHVLTRRECPDASAALLDRYVASALDALGERT